MSRMNLSEYVGHVNYIQLNVRHCLMLSCRVGVRITDTFNVQLVSCYAHVFVRLSVVIVTLREMYEHRKCCTVE